MTYEEFLVSKLVTHPACGLSVPELNPMLFPFQRDITKWALRRGRAAVFADCGLGKTPIELEWAARIAQETVANVLILAPLAVAFQHVSEGEKFGIPVNYCRSQDKVQTGVTVTNYEMLEHFDASRFAGIVLDESSILKNFDGKTRNAIIQSFARTPYRLAATATPAPNDYMELGNHAEFLGVMTRVEMLSMFFVHDGGDTSEWRLKGHAEETFWKWVCSWAVMLRKPSDLGYSDEGFNLPEMRTHEIVVQSKKSSDFLFPMEAHTLSERLTARRDSLTERVDAAAKLVNASDEIWVCCVNLNAEADALEKAIPGSVQIRGADSIEDKQAKLASFTNGEIRVFITKPSITGMGLNWQHCHKLAMVGISDSWEDYYQVVRRHWRFGQQSPVDVWVITSEAEGAVVANIKRKDLAAQVMASSLIQHMHIMTEESIKGAVATRDEYETGYADSIGRGGLLGDILSIKDAKPPDWTMQMGDCVEVVKDIAPDSIDYSIFSPPFASLYTYSASERDMGNCNNYEQFAKHFEFLVTELFRVIKPGRNVSFHCMNLPTTKSHHGYIGIQDFRGDLIRMFQRQGFIYHSEVCIWKDPVTAMQRTKALGLLWKQLKKDSCMSRQGIPDYLVTMRKPGVNDEPVEHTAEDFPVEQWQQWASPVWASFAGFDDRGFLNCVGYHGPGTDGDATLRENRDAKLMASGGCAVNPSDTLQHRSAREDKDERHICPLQLQVIHRGLLLWSNPGDLILSPFAGIGSEGYMSILNNRRFVGIELKKSYFDQAVGNLQMAVQKKRDEKMELL